jgi:arylsulfatase A-like enzyme/chitodextrinase
MGKSPSRRVTSVALLVSLLCAVALGPTRGAAILQERTIASNTVDASRVLAPKWRQVSFTALASGSASFRLEWTGSASLRFQVTRTDGTIIGGNTSTAGSPKSANVVLVAGTTYRANVWSVSGVATYRLSLVEDVPDVAAPSTPTGLDAISVTDDAVTLQWLPSSDNDVVERYTVYRDGVPTGSSTTPGFVDSGLAAGTTYTYGVEAVDRSGNVSGRSAPLVVETLTPEPPDVVAPSVPVGVRVVSVGLESVSVAWDASSDDRGVAGYRVWIDGVVVGSTEVLEFSVSSLSPGTVYSVVVTAFDAAGNESSGSDPLVVETSTPDVAAPSVPSGVRVVSVGLESASVAWDASSDDRGVAGYRVWVDGVVVGSTDALEFSVSSLSPGTAYEVVVTAFDAAGNESSPSEALSIETPLPPPDVVAPSVPVGVRVVSVGLESVSVAWDASSDDRGVAGYRVWVDGVVVGSTDALEFSVSSLSPGTAYEVVVTAFDAAGNESLPSEVLTVETETPDVVAPSVPVGVRVVSVGLESVSVAWDASSDDRGVAGYRVWVDGVVVGSTDALEFSVSSLSPGTAYEVVVTAFDAAGNESLPSEVLTVETETPADPPNIIVINTDDQRADTLEYLPKIRQWLADGGTQYTNGYVSTPSCCPSRATLMSGRYVHNNNQFGQQTLGFDQNATIQRWLRDAGYFTGHSGKYLHWLPLSQVPPHWDRWTYFKGGYTNVWMRWDQVTRQTSGYSTTITFDRALDYLDDFESRDDDRPFYLHLTPVAPHSPFTAEAKYATATVPPLVTTPAHFETDRSDKPSFVRNRSTSLTSAQNTRTAMIRTLYSVDDQVDRLMRRLEELGELDNTLVVFTSDNGYFWGEHSLTSKFLPYTQSVRVPLLIRWPGGYGAGVVDERWATHVDIAPTLLAAAGISTDGLGLDGRDLRNGTAREVAFTEYYYDTSNGNSIPTWAAIETEDYLYVEYYSTSRTRTTPTFREYYDKTVDPYLLQNRLGDGTTANDPDVASLSAALAAVKDCSGAVCP